MTNEFEEEELTDQLKSDQPLTGMQKLLFAMLCWGVQSWSQAKSFKANGYVQKYKDAIRAMHTGLVVYSVGIVLFILLLLLL